MSEIIEVGTIFVGIGMMVFMFVIAYIFFLISRNVKNEVDRDEKYIVLEEVLLDKVASKKGIDLTHEVKKREVFNGRQFKRRIQQEVFNEMFGEQKDGKTTRK